MCRRMLRLSSVLVNETFENWGWYPGWVEVDEVDTEDSVGWGVAPPESGSSFGNANQIIVSCKSRRARPFAGECWAAQMKSGKVTRSLKPEAWS